MRDEVSVSTIRPPTAGGLQNWPRKKAEDGGTHSHHTSSQRGWAEPKGIGAFFVRWDRCLCIVGRNGEKGKRDRKKRDGGKKKLTIKGGGREGPMTFERGNRDGT